MKFRGAYSHDIRAPNMQELFLAGATGNALISMPANSPTPGIFNIHTQTNGNLNLKPEKANTLTAGVVVTPSFLPGFAASFDFWNIKMKDRIGTTGGQTAVDFCYTGHTEFCDNIVFVNGALDAVLSQPVNFASQHAKGFDLEVSYRTPLSAISAKLPGNFSIHAAATRYLKNVVDDLVFPVDYAGVIANGGTDNPASPKWMYRVSAFYEIDPVTINLVGRGFNSGVYSNEWIECSSNCPVSTPTVRTINNNRIPGALYFDGSVSVKLRPAGTDTRLTFVVNNIFNRDPAPFGIEPLSFYFGFPPAARPLYDTIGRVIRVALTTKF